MLSAFSPELLTLAGAFILVMAGVLAAAASCSKLSSHGRHSSGSGGLPDSTKLIAPTLDAGDGQGEYSLCVNRARESIRECGSIHREFLSLQVREKQHERHNTAIRSHAAHDVCAEFRCAY